MANYQLVYHLVLRIFHNRLTICLFPIYRKIIKRTHKENSKEYFLQNNKITIYNIHKYNIHIQMWFTCFTQYHLKSLKVDLRKILNFCYKHLVALSFIILHK